MPRRFMLVAAAAVLLQAACAGDPTPIDSRGAMAPVAAVAAVSDESRRLGELVDAYFEDYLRLNPLAATSIGDPRYDDRFEVSISPEWRARAERTELDYLAQLRTIDTSKLAGQDLLTYQVFESARERELEGFQFPGHLIPLNQFYSVPNTFAQLGSGSGQQPFKTPQDYDKFLRRLDGFVAWTDQAIANMREGVTRGYTLPKVLTERTLPQLSAHVVAPRCTGSRCATCPTRSVRRTASASPPPTAPRSKARWFPPTAGCTITCAMNTCRKAVRRKA